MPCRMPATQVTMGYEEMSRVSFTAAKMQRLGIETGSDLRSKPLSLLQQHFGKSAAWHQTISKGEDDRPVVADRPRKSSGSETTFQEDLTEPGAIEAGVPAMADDVWAWCEKAEVFGRTVAIKVKFADFRQVIRSRSFSASVVNHRQLRQVCLDLVRSLFPPAQGVRLVGVTVSNFAEGQERADNELPLFADDGQRHATPVLGRGI
ncbi:MAG: hypothetical protein GEU92_14410 [Alphaproteobacteria bacterium]|nr:hypothetical protein [Alphaproteobacteria bacterium]